MSAPTASLADLQRAFQDYLLAHSDGLAAAVRDTAKADRATLLDVYRDAYSLRLIEVLTNDYPGLMAMARPRQSCTRAMRSATCTSASSV